MTPGWRQASRMCSVGSAGSGSGEAQRSTTALNHPVGQPPKRTAPPGEGLAKAWAGPLRSDQAATTVTVMRAAMSPCRRTAAR